ncbi:MAG: hypothetical protein IPI23_22095 [Bacteroidetes bacterium]|nr:hypothetical protein [Bacteroidota bacterium]
MNNNDDTVRMVRAIVLLPPGVRVDDVFVEEKKVGMGGYAKVSGECKDKNDSKCTVYWNSSVSVNRSGGNLKKHFDSNVQIDLAYLDVNETADIKIVLNCEPADTAKKNFGAFVSGSVPDHDPASNFQDSNLLVYVEYFKRLIYC